MAKTEIVYKMYGIVAYAADKWIFHKYYNNIKIQAYLLSYSICPMVQNCNFTAYCTHTTYLVSNSVKIIHFLRTTCAHEKLIE